MKYLILAAAIATRLALAQDLSTLPPCGQKCITNMLAKARELGCPDANVACLCLNKDFGNGITDCTNESCLGGEDKNSVIDVGVKFCADALAKVSGGSIVTTASVTALASGISRISASKTSDVSASKTSQVSASKSSQVSASESSKASATTKEESTVTETVPLSTASVVVATLTDSAGNLVTSTIGDLVEGGAVAITTTDSRGTTFVTTATALPPANSNSTAAEGGEKNTASGVPVTTTNSVGSTIVTTQAPSATTNGAGSTTKASAAPSSSTGAAVRMAAAGCAGFVGMAAMVLL